MPSILTCLIAKRIGNQTKLSTKEAYALRDLAASILQLVIDRYSSSYSTLKARITRSLFKAYMDNKKPFPTHYGAIIGLRVMGKEVVRALLVPNLKIYAEFLLAPAFASDADPSLKSDAEKCLDAIMVVPRRIG
jgi:transcription initiation factor TFIID subunit 6